MDGQVNIRQECAMNEIKALEVCQAVSEVDL